jgi:hypothetical protein
MSPRKIHNNIPDFLIIGAGKSGTTSLDNYLKQHPQIFIPSVKEPNFYGFELTKIEDFMGDEAEIAYYRSCITTLDDYLKLFQGAGDHQVKGETSNTYLYHDSAPDRIYHYNPDMKLIAIFRQPADRLYSRFLHLARDKQLPTPNFSSCLDRDTIWWRRGDLIKEGFYFKNLSRFYDLFPASNIKVYLYEELNKNAEEVLKDIYRFLEVDDSFQADLSVRYNQSGIVKNKFLDWIYGTQGVAQKTIKALLPTASIEKLRSNIQVQRIVNTLKSKNLERPKIDPEVRRILTQEVYLNDIQKLEKLTNKNLQHWFIDKE